MGWWGWSPRAIWAARPGRSARECAGERWHERAEHSRRRGQRALARGRPGGPAPHGRGVAPVRQCREQLPAGGAGVLNRRRADVDPRGHARSRRLPFRPGPAGRHGRAVLLPEFESHQRLPMRDLPLAQRRGNFPDYIRGHRRRQSVAGNRREPGRAELRLPAPDLEQLLLPLARPRGHLGDSGGRQSGLLHHRRRTGFGAVRRRVGEQLQRWADRLCQVP